jgi:hypothetical protein
MHSSHITVQVIKADFVISYNERDSKKQKALRDPIMKL